MMRIPSLLSIGFALFAGCLEWDGSPARHGILFSLIEHVDGAHDQLVNAVTLGGRRRGGPAEARKPWLHALIR